MFLLYDPTGLHFANLYKFKVEITTCVNLTEGEHVLCRIQTSRAAAARKGSCLDRPFAIRCK
jgi:hypothetical protein